MAEFKFTDLVEPVAVDKNGITYYRFRAVALVQLWQI